MPEFLLEVGFEEMPAPWLPGLGTQLRQRFEAEAGRERFEPGAVRSFWTPRRLVLRADVRARQEDREENVWGPSLKAAKDASGAWTGAAQGFARKNALSVEELREGVKDAAKPDERHLLVVRKTSGRAAVEVLPGVIASTLRGLAFPKRMSWDAWLEDGKGAFPFGRPVRWLLATLDGTVVPFVIYEMAAGVKGRPLVESGQTTFGHRFLPKGAGGRPLTPIRSFAELQTRLAEHFVVLDAREREARIRKELGASHELIAEWVDLVEHPAVVFGRIPPEFSHLPREVLETVLVHHQKYVPLVSEGKVTRFAAVTNTDGAAASEIARGMERVVVARLRDAAFFFREDMKRPLAERAGDLSGVTFHQGLGSYREKAERMAALVDSLAELIPRADLAAAREAARLAKADLTTLMVREFTELQGVMGGLYLEAQGAPLEVATAVRWHYHPVSIEEGGLPSPLLAGREARIFAVVSLADKLDTLAGYFGLGLNPTGSSDPYGLRRAAQGAIRVLLDFWSGGPPPSLQGLVAAAIAGYGGALKRPPAEVARDLEGFLLDRLEYLLSARGFPPEEVAAVVYTPTLHALADPADCLVRLRALHRVRAEAQEDFEHLAVAFKRAKNILDQQGPAASIDPKLFESDAERDLHEAISRLGSADGDYDARLRSLAGFRAPVDRFFDQVLVMAEDPKVRSNRLGLLAQALSLFYRIADISRLGG